MCLFHPNCFVAPSFFFPRAKMALVKINVRTARRNMLMPLLVAARTRKEYLISVFTPVIRGSEDPVDNLILIEKELTTIYKWLGAFARLFSQTERSAEREGSFWPSGIIRILHVLSQIPNDWWVYVLYNAENASVGIFHVKEKQPTRSRTLRKKCINLRFLHWSLIG